MFQLIQRCMSLLIYMTEEECAQYLDGKDQDRGEAFLAIKAAGILLRGEGVQCKSK